MMLFQFYNQAIETIAWFDLIVAAIIGVVILLLGQAVVSYEVFTGKSLPRRGLMRHWRRAIILAAGYSIPVGFSIAIALRPLYSLTPHYHADDRLLRPVQLAILTPNESGTSTVYGRFVASQRLY